MLRSSIVLASLLLSSPAWAALVNVSTADALRDAIAAAKPGDEIVLADGTYTFTDKVSCSASATPASPIVVRAANRLGARIEMNTVEGFAVTGAAWQFDGLDIQGTCADDDDCEHAFHVSGGATDFVLRNSRLRDFNAQIKVNATAGGAQIPHRGLVEGNEFTDTHARNTARPVNKINIDTGDDWVVRANYVHDANKSGGGITYAGFMKSGGKRGLFERNLVVCVKDQPATGVHIGLSFGGGGTGNAFCAPAFDASVPCSVEHDGGTMRNNVIANCDDVGIYLNRSKDTHLLHNTLVATTGIDFRFGTTSGESRGNVLGGKIRNRDGATHTSTNDLTDVATATFEAMYVAPRAGDLHRKGDLSALLGKGPALPAVADDYCGQTRSGAWDLGAIQHTAGDCEVLPVLLAPAPPPGADGGTTPAPGSTPGPGGTPPGSAPGGTEGGDDSGCAIGRGPTTSLPLLLGLAVAGLAIGRRRRR